MFMDRRMEGRWDRQTRWKQCAPYRHTFWIYNNLSYLAETKKLNAASQLHPQAPPPPPPTHFFIHLSVATTEFRIMYNVSFAIESLFVSPNNNLRYLSRNQKSAPLLFFNIHQGQQLILVLINNVPFQSNLYFVSCELQYKFQRNLIIRT